MNYYQPRRSYVILIIIIVLCIAIGCVYRYSAQDYQCTNTSPSLTESGILLKDLDQEDVENILDIKPPEFDTRFLNPCWWEEVNIGINPYKDSNYFLPTKSRNVIAHSVKKTMYQIVKWYESGGLTDYPKIPGKEGYRKRLRCLPYFYLAGVGKCGTTDLFRKLIQHPQILHVQVLKEIHWWSRARTGVFVGSAPPLRDYIDLFDRHSHEIWQNTTSANVPYIFGDGSPTTMNLAQWWLDKSNDPLHHTAPVTSNAHRIHHLTPEAKIIVTLRQPSIRFRSSYYFTANKLPYKSQASARHFHEVTVKVVARMKTCIKQYDVKTCVFREQPDGEIGYLFTRCIYHIFLEDWLKVFPRKQIYMSRLEDYAKNQNAVIADIHKFLGLEPLSSYEFSGTTLKARKSGMLNKTKVILDKFFEPHNKILAQLLKDDKYLWKD